MYCSQCGKPVPAESKFCPFCGAVAADAPRETFPQENIFRPKQKLSAERNIFDNFVYVFKNFADFSGRASRAEYWYFTLASIIMQLVLGIISAELYFIYCVIAIIPGIAVSVRRLHDVGKSGWWLLICLTIIGAFYIIYLDCLPGEKTNRYGPNPYDAT